MPPGLYIFLLSLLSISLVYARGGWSENSDRDYGPGSGYGQNDEWGSGFDDDEDGDDDDDSFSGIGRDRSSEYPPIVKPNKRPGEGARPEPDDKFVIVPSRPDHVDENDNGIIYDGPKQTETESESPIVIETVKTEGGEEADGEEAEDGSQGEHLSRSIIQTPGLLPGIIGGAVVGLLCAVLLVMFIVYRMRKKDEGSYALEEPKMTSPSRGYTRAPTKEYWA